MKIGEFFICSAVMALMVSIVIFMSSSVTGFGFILAVGLFIYFIAVILGKMMWGFSGVMDDGLQRITGGSHP